MFFLKPGSSNKVSTDFDHGGKRFIGFFLSIMWVRNEPEAGSPKQQPNKRLLSGSDFLF